MQNDDKPSLTKQGLHWFTSHALWEVAKTGIALVISAGLFSVGVIKFFHAALDTGIAIFLAVVGVVGIALVFRTVQWPATRRSEQAALEVFLFSSGVPVTLTPSVGRVTVHLMLLSTKPTELVFVHASVRNNKGALLECDRSEPIPIPAMESNLLSVESKLSPQEFATFEKGEWVNLDGYAKFRDGGAIKQFRFSFSTIPSL